MDKVVGIVFEGKSKTYNFKSNLEDLNPSDYVLVDTSKGKQIGIIKDVQSIDVDVEKKGLKDVIRKATEKDLIKYEKNKADSKDALKECKKIVKDHNLNMLMTKAEYTFDREKLVFSFLADNRIDFRELVKDLAGKFKTRIELVQIGVRDKAKEIGGVGTCGQVLCCHKYKSDFDNISINMAKNQGIALNPNKINGMCGRLLCCLKFEDECYKECKRGMPKIGSFYKTKQGEGKVVSLDPLRQIIVVNIPGTGYVEEIYEKGCK